MLRLLFTVKRFHSTLTFNVCFRRSVCPLVYCWRAAYFLGAVPTFTHWMVPVCQKTPDLYLALHETCGLSLEWVFLNIFQFYYSLLGSLIPFYDSSTTPAISYSQ